MSEKDPEFKIPEGLPEQLSEVNRDMTEFMADVRARREHPGESVSGGDEDVVGAAAEAVHKLHLVEDGQLNVHEEIGHGDRKKMRLQALGQELTDGVQRVNELYDPLAKRDLLQFKLQFAQLAVAQMASTNTRQIDTFIENLAFGSDIKLTPESKNTLIRLHDSLGVLKNAFETGEGFTERTSGLWDDKEATELTLENVEHSKDIVKELTSSVEGTAIAFLTKFQLSLLRAADIPSLPRRGASYQAKAGHEKKLRNAQNAAWKDWHEMPGESVPYDRGQEAQIFKLEPPK